MVEIGDSPSMIEPNTTSAQLLFSTVRLECTLNSGGSSIGTAFLFAYRIDQEKMVPFLMTNKHVVKDAATGTFYVHEGRPKAANGPNMPTGDSIPISINNFIHAWVMHPDPDVDLCAMPIEPLRTEASKQGKNFFLMPFVEPLIPLEEQMHSLNAIEEVLMVGYPIGLWDSVNNMPIVRRGITALHPAVDFQGKKIGIVDMACFPGSSGSPIVIVNEGAYSTPQGLMVGGRFFLMGVLYAGPQYTADGSIEIVTVPTRSKPIAQTAIPSHLGFYIKSKVIREWRPILLKHFGAG
jgi:hypothetical protein